MAPQYGTRDPLTMLCLYLPQADVVVTDLLLAEDDGIWFLAEARRLPRRLLAIALTG